MSLPRLPVSDVLPSLKEELSAHHRAVLVAPPGAGKTTLVPLALLHEPWLREKKLILLEPRRLAARGAAHRMAHLLGENRPGETVGYRMRFDTNVGPQTRIEVVTEGVLARMLQTDPALEGVGAVVFDEFHERSLHADLGLALSLRTAELLRTDLRVLLMSATLDPGPISHLLGEAPVLSSSGRQFPVETRYGERPRRGRGPGARDPVERSVATAVARALDEEEGDVLVFLPGAREIQRTADRLGELGLPPHTDIYPLFGNLPREAQDRAVAPSSHGRRKVVLASSIAETSLTIEGVRVVVDSGLMRVPRFDPSTGMGRLETVRVTRDAADQRRGRAGRTGPGVCIRLWPQEEDRGLRARRRPEILETDLTPLALELAAWGEEPDELAWLDPPPKPALRLGFEVLKGLGAVDERGKITKRGKDLARLGAHPRIGHLLVKGRERGLGAAAADLAALLGEPDVFRWRDGPPDPDLRLRMEAVRRAGEGRGTPTSVRGQPVASGRLRRVVRQARNWRRRLGLDPDSRTRPEDVEWTGWLSALAYPDRVAMKREGRQGSFRFRSGQGGRLDLHGALADTPWLVAANVTSQGRGGDVRIQQAAPVTREEVEELFSDQVETVEEVEWDPNGQRVRAHRRGLLGALVLEEAPLTNPDPEAVEKALLEGIREAGLGVLPWSSGRKQLRERLEFLHRMDPDQWPSSSEEVLAEELDTWLGPFLSGMKGLQELKGLPLEQALLSRLPLRIHQDLDRLAPSHIQVPSGSRIAVDYQDPAAPVLAVRIQEVFGLQDTPKVGGGRIPVTLHLLSPAGRPAQVTRDLASFWRQTYFEVKKDLKGRYPKHFWPEDPANAPATRGLRPT